MTNHHMMPFFTVVMGALFHFYPASEVIALGEGSGLWHKALDQRARARLRNLMLSIFQ